MPKPDYDTSIARMAGNIACGLVTLSQCDVQFTLDRKHIAEYSVALARAIVDEVKRTTIAEFVKENGTLAPRGDSTN